MESKKVAIMQPYFLPYIGYFQLINAVDVFVLLDDANFIKKGFIHRNELLLNNALVQFTLPIEKLSQNRKICEHKYCFDKVYKAKFIKTIETYFCKKKNYELVSILLQNILDFEDINVAEFNKNSLNQLNEYLGIETKMVLSSNLNYNRELNGVSKIINICELLKATDYINPIGGMKIYSNSHFMKHRLNLSFLQTEENVIKEYNGSIINHLFNSEKETLKNLLNEYSFVVNQ